MKIIIIDYEWMKEFKQWTFLFNQGYYNNRLILNSNQDIKMDMVEWLSDDGNVENLE